MIIAIDPGPLKSGYATIVDRADGRTLPSDCGELGNLMLMENLRAWHEFELTPVVVLEDVRAYEIARQQLIDTAKWIGSFRTATNMPYVEISRQKVKKHLLGRVTGSDAEVRSALIEMLGPVGTKNNKGPLYDVRGHAWAALAVGITYIQTREQS